MSKHFSLSELQTWDRFTRANFINSLSGFKSLSLIGTVNGNGVSNLAVFSNVGCGSGGLILENVL